MLWRGGEALACPYLLLHFYLILFFVNMVYCVALADLKPSMQNNLALNSRDSPAAFTSCFVAVWMLESGLHPCGALSLNYYF